MIKDKLEDISLRFKNFFRARPKNFLGIDVGASSIRIIELGRKGQVLRLENYGEVKLADFSNRPIKIFKKNTLSLSNRDISKVIKALLKETGIQVKEAAFSIPDFGSFFTGVELPVMNKDEISEAVKYQVRPYVPLPLSDVTLDWSIIEGEPSKTAVKVLVVAIPNNIISYYQEIAQLSNLELKFLEPEVFSLARSSVKGESTKRVIGLVDIGAWSTTCSVLDNGVLKISHSFNIAGNDLTKVVARFLNIDYNKAESVKAKYGLLPEGQTNSDQNIRKVLIPLVGSILQEVKKAFHNFHLQEGKEVDKIILAGGLSKMPGLKEFFSVELKKQIINADSFLDIASPPILTDVLKEMGPYYSIALGLAMKGLE